ALKVPRIDSISGVVGLKRFITEQQLVSQLEHPCLLTCYDVGIDSRSGLLYIASELALGGDTERLAGPVSPMPLIFAIGADLFAGLAHAHSQHVVHRDVKPANVLLASPAPTASGRLRAKLSDFGLAKRLRSLGASARTKAGQILGSPWFMAPEQMLAHDTRSPVIDVYGGAITIYYLLTGTVPLRIDRPVYELGPAAACLAALDDARVPLRERRPDVPVAVGQWVDLLVSRDAARRGHIGAGQVAEMFAAHAR
ncbi:MAG: serine/threonine-protein kinase, partial [Polyangiales bacterium]